MIGLTETTKLLAISQAANSLNWNGEQAAKSDDSGRVLFGAALLRASAIGWKEVSAAFKDGCREWPTKEAKHDAKLTAKYARGANAIAAAICKKINLPVRSKHDMQEYQFWKSWCYLHNRVHDSKTAYALILLSMHKEAVAILETATKLAMKGEHDAVAAWHLCNAGELVKAQASLESILDEIEDLRTDGPHAYEYMADVGVMNCAHHAAGWLNAVIREYRKDLYFSKLH